MSSGTVTITSVTYHIQFSGTAGFDKISFDVTFDTEKNGMTSAQLDTVTADGGLLEQGLRAMANTIINGSGGLVTAANAIKRTDGFASKTIS